MHHHLRNPLMASAFAFFTVYFFLKATSKGNEPNHKFIRPATFVGLLVYIIVYYGNREPIMD